MTLGEVLKTMVDACKVMIVNGDLVINGNSDAMYAMLRSETLDKKVVDMEARSNTLWIWLKEHKPEHQG